MKFNRFSFWFDLGCSYSTTKRTAKEPSFFCVELSNARMLYYQRCVRGGERNNVFYFAVYENYYIAHFFYCTINNFLKVGY